MTKVLCIEDDRFIGEMYERSLKKAGYEFDLRADGDEGLQAAMANYYDFILLDLMLPNKKGDEILTELKKPGTIDPKTKIIMLTNFQQDDAARMSLENVADAYLIKADITPRRLISIIERMS
ncbi:MAG: response regulator [Candidatus Nomurabacteria bacterium]|jgi:DNA-binding response OmpR family regulator|nr:response regulator [Candidatus Nomurabacteria bacterium]